MFITATDPQQPPLTELVAYLPASRLEALSLDALKSESAELNSVLPLLMAHSSVWSDQLSRAVVTRIKKRIADGKDTVADWEAKAALKQFARFVSPDLYDELASGWPVNSEAWSGWSRSVDAFQSLLAFRRDMHRAISEKEQSL